jgi:hypothetical protein
MRILWITVCVSLDAQDIIGIAKARRPSALRSGLGLMLISLSRTEPSLCLFSVRGVLHECDFSVYPLLARGVIQQSRSIPINSHNHQPD